MESTQSCFSSLSFAFPSGEVISLGKESHRSVGATDMLAIVPPDNIMTPLGVIWHEFPLQPQASDSQRQDYLMFNWLSRPRLSDEEIQLMPVSEVIDLYYTLRTPKDNCRYVPHPVISANLGILGDQHEYSIQQRIYNLRPELHQIVVGAKKYIILLEPSQMKIPPCGPTVLTQVTQGVVLGILGGALGAIGTAASVAVNTAEAASSAYQSIQSNRELNKVTGLAANIRDGVLIAGQSIPNPAHDMAKISRLDTQYRNWQALVETYQKSMSSILQSALHICGPEWSLFPTPNQSTNKGVQQAVQKFLQGYPLYKKFFYSDSVMKMVYPEAVSFGLTQQPPAVQAGIGIGIGALLLLLL